MWKIWNHSIICTSGNRIAKGPTGWTDTYTGLGWSTDPSSKRWWWTPYNWPYSAYTHSTAYFSLSQGGYTIQSASPTVTMTCFWNNTCR